MGSLRYLRESPTARYKHIRLNEVTLLVLRCSLVIILVSLLAGAWSTWFEPQQRKWLVLEEGVERSGQMKPIIDGLQREGFEVRLMANGFPLAAEGTFREPIDNYWSAVRKLSSYSLDSVVVVSFNYQRKFKGERITMPLNMKWLINHAEEKEFIAQKLLADNDSVWVRKGRTSPFMTSFETIKAPAQSLRDSMPVAAGTELDISIVAGEEFAYDKKILLAALEAVQSITQNKITVNTKKVTEGRNSTGDLIFWLANEPPPASKGGITIGYRDCIRQNLPLLVSSIEALHDCGKMPNATWIMTKRLNEEIALRENLPLHLAKLILPTLKKNEYDQRVLPEPMMWTSNTNESETVDHEERGNLDLYLTILLLLTLASERTLAFKRNQ